MIVYDNYFLPLACNRHMYQHDVSTWCCVLSLYFVTLFNKNHAKLILYFDVEFINDFNHIIENLKHDIHIIAI